jgi:hypothetical protein
MSADKIFYIVRYKKEIKYSRMVCHLLIHVKYDYDFVEM